MKLCKNCPYFKVDYEPLKDVDFGRASCSKHDLITDFLDYRKFERLICIEEGVKNELSGNGGE